MGNGNAGCEGQLETWSVGLRIVAVLESLIASSVDLPSQRLSCFLCSYLFAVSVSSARALASLASSPTPARPVVLHSSCAMLGKYLSPANCAI